jgi:hypothetical protein
VSDHEIDLVHTDEDDERVVIESEVGGELGYLMKYQVDGYPGEDGKDEKGDQDRSFLSQKAPDVELPGDEKAFDEGIDIDGDGIADIYPYEEEADDLDGQADDQEEEEGLIAPLHTAKAYQPHYNR